MPKKLDDQQSRPSSSPGKHSKCDARSQGIIQSEKIGRALTKKCACSPVELPVSEFGLNKNAPDGYKYCCKKCNTRIGIESKTRRPKHTIFYTKMNRARRSGTPFSLKFEDIVWPVRCPALGTTLEYVAGLDGRGQRDPSITPSFDRKDPSKGYTADNTVIISKLANNIKSSATHEQIRLVADWLEAGAPAGVTGPP